MQIGFEGGQMPLQRRLPKVGFTSKVNILTQDIRYDRLSVIKEKEVSLELLKKYKLIKSKIKTVRIIGPCTIKDKKIIKDMYCTKSVIEFIGNNYVKIKFKYEFWNRWVDQIRRAQTEDIFYYICPDCI